MIEGWIYVMQMGGLPYVKVGFSTDVVSRDIRETMRRAEEAVAALEADELPEPCWAAYT